MADLTVTVGPGKDYPTLKAALDANVGDLTATGLNRILTIVCYNMEDTTPAGLSQSYVTDSTHYVRIVGAPTEKTALNSGVWSTERYRLVMTGSAIAISNDADYTRFEDLQIELIKADTADGSACIYVQTHGENASISGCIFRGALSSAYNTYGVFTETSISCRNCLAYNFGDGNDTGFHGNGGTANFYNCTAVDCATGFAQLGGGTVNAYNCGASGCPTPLSGTISQTTCSSTSPSFVDESGDNFHLAYNDDEWGGQGTDYSGTFTDDIDGNARPTGVPWDIGADQRSEAVCWGDQGPHNGETCVSWQQWQTAPATPIVVSGDQDWGDADLADGTPILGPVVDTGDSDWKTFTATPNRYGGAGGPLTLFIRGSASVFGQHDGSPSWSEYVAAVNQPWRYVQLKAEQGE